MTAVILFGIQPNINQILCFFHSKDASAQRYHVGVVVLLCHLGHERRNKLRAADALYLVGRHAYPKARSAAYYAQIRLAGNDIFRALSAVLRIIHRVRRVDAEVLHLESPALEMFDKLNDAGVPCSMLTGEESIPVEGAQVVSSTIELCNFNAHYKTAVIDEAQMIADKDRGAAWLKAICLVDAEVVHVCMAPEALPFIKQLITSFEDPYNVVQHERLAPLQYAGQCRGYHDFKPDDAIICFSRKNVLSTAAILEKEGQAQ